MTPVQFIMARYLRIYPLYLVGFGIGASGAGLSLLLGGGDFSVSDYVLAVGSGLLMLPSPTAHVDAHLVPFNFPAWSLISEMAINIVYAFTWRWWRKPWLPLLVVCSGIILWLYQRNTGSIGWGAYWTNGWMGPARVCFSFSMGVLIRREWTSRACVTNIAYILPLGVILLFSGTLPWLSDAVIVLFVFPILILIGATVEPPKAGLFTLLGTLSYPMYVIHVPLMQLLERASTVLHLHPTAWAPWTGLLLALLSAVAALLLDRWYDLPVRRWLSGRLVPRPSRIDRGL